MLERVFGSWVVRGLSTGAVSSVIDHAVGLGLAVAGMPTRGAATGGKVAGAVFSYVAHRRFTFTDHRQSLKASGLKYTVTAVVITAFHGQVAVWLRDGAGLPYLAAAVLADALVVTPSWLLALRYVIFPAAKPGNDEAGSIVPKPPGT